MTGRNRSQDSFHYFRMPLNHTQDIGTENARNSPVNLE